MGVAAGDGLLDVVGAGVGDAGIRRHGEHAIHRDGDGPLDGREIGLDADGAVGELAAAGDMEPHRLAAIEIAAVDVPGAGERVGGDRGADAGEGERDAGGGIDVLQRAVADLDIGERHVVGRDPVGGGGAPEASPPCPWSSTETRTLGSSSAMETT
ncbi:MAG: hypothetical protein WDM84_05515 [Bauldia sp.]